MTELQSALFRKARRALASARLMVNHEDAETAINRAYYAMFYAAMAALDTRGERPKTHKGTRGRFDFHFIEPGLIPFEIGKMLAFAHELRIRSDYDAIVATDLAATSDLVNDAEHFVNAVEEMMLGEAETS